MQIEIQCVKNKTKEGKILSWHWFFFLNIKLQFKTHIKQSCSYQRHHFSQPRLNLYKHQNYQQIQLKKWQRNNNNNNNNKTVRLTCNASPGKTTLMHGEGRPIHWKRSPRKNMAQARSPTIIKFFKPTWKSPFYRLFKEVHSCPYQLPEPRLSKLEPPPTTSSSEKIIQQIPID